mmetsp:Transcript_87296/g.154700  ORF Transcript_87296/g.154700 Transcript_87296/m.154700 type:complete len:229 (+) Transcript_87296:772-1458(+)
MRPRERNSPRNSNVVKNGTDLEPETPMSFATLEAKMFATGLGRGSPVASDTAMASSTRADTFSACPRGVAECCCAQLMKIWRKSATSGVEKRTLSMIRRSAFALDPSNCSRSARRRCTTAQNGVSKLPGCPMSSGDMPVWLAAVRDISSNCIMSLRASRVSTVTPTCFRNQRSSPRPKPSASDFRCTSNKRRMITSCAPVKPACRRRFAAASIRHFSASSANSGRSKA